MAAEKQGSSRETGEGGHAEAQGGPNPGIEPSSPTLQVDSLLSESPGTFIIIKILDPGVTTDSS